MKKIVYGLVCLSGIIFSLGQIARIEIQPGLVLNLFDVVILGGVLLFFLHRRVKKSFHSFLPLALFAGTSLLSLAVHSLNYGLHPFILSTLYLVRLVSYWLIFLVLQSAPAKNAMIRRTLLFSGIAIIILGYIQYAFYPSLRNLFYLGWDEHLFRMFSTFLDPNFAGAFFAIFITFLAHYFLSTKKVVGKIGYGLLISSTLIALYLTYSRTGLLMLIVGIVTFFIAYGKKQYALIGLVVLVLGFAIFANKHIEGLNPFRIASTVARIETVQNGIKIFSQNPLFGVGFNAYRYEQIRQGYRVGEVAMISHADAGVDNSYVFLLATSGVVGSALYALFVFRVVIQSIEKLKGSERAMVVATTASFLTGGMFINLLFYTPVLFFMIVVWGTTRSK